MNKADKLISEWKSSTPTKVRRSEVEIVILHFFPDSRSGGKEPFIVISKSVRTFYRHAKKLGNEDLHGQ